VLGISRRGLINRAWLNSEGNDESHFLAPLEESIARGTTLAEEMLALYNGRWQTVRRSGLRRLRLLTSATGHQFIACPDQGSPP
jgi:hypothetical protein